MHSAGAPPAVHRRHLTSGCRASAPGLLDMDATTLDDLLAHQDGVVSRTQSLAAGLDDDDIARMLRRRAWRRIHPGVYLDHTGPPTRRQREWAAVLHYWPAALCHASAVWPADGAGRAPSWCAEDVVHVAIEHPATGSSSPGCGCTAWWTCPRGCGGTSARRGWCSRRPCSTCARPPGTDRGTRGRGGPVPAAQDHRRAAARCPGPASATAPRGMVALDAGRRRRGGVLGARAGYLSRVERAHGLPRGERQAVARASGGVVFRDVEYPRFALVVELDGRVGHELVRDRWRDMERDLVAAAGDSLTLRCPGATWTSTPVPPPYASPASCSGAAGRARHVPVGRAAPSTASGVDHRHLLRAIDPARPRDDAASGGPVGWTARCSGRRAPGRTWRGSPS